MQRKAGTADLGTQNRERGKKRQTALLPPFEQMMYKNRVIFSEPTCATNNKQKVNEPELLAFGTSSSLCSLLSILPFVPSSSSIAGRLNSCNRVGRPGKTYLHCFPNGQTHA